MDFSNCACAPRTILHKEISAIHWKNALKSIPMFAINHQSMLAINRLLASERRLRHCRKAAKFHASALDTTLWSYLAYRVLRYYHCKSERYTQPPAAIHSSNVHFHLLSMSLFFRIGTFSLLPFTLPFEIIKGRITRIF